MKPALATWLQALMTAAPPVRRYGGRLRKFPFLRYRFRCPPQQHRRPQVQEHGTSSENSGGSRMNICIDPEPALPNFSASLWSGLPHLALAEFRTGAHRGLSSDLQTTVPAGITHEVMS
jgi:hypothetical protein